MATKAPSGDKTTHTHTLACETCLTLALSSIFPQDKSTSDCELIPCFTIFPIAGVETLPYPLPPPRKTVMPRMRAPDRPCHPFLARRNAATRSSLRPERRWNRIMCSGES